MRITELIQKLQAIQADCGDIMVVYEYLPQISDEEEKYFATAIDKVEVVDDAEYKYGISYEIGQHNTEKAVYAVLH